VFGVSSVEVAVKPSFGPGVVLDFGLHDDDEVILLTCSVGGEGLHHPLAARYCHSVVNASTWEQSVSPKATTSLRKALLRTVKMTPRFAMGLDGTKFSVKVSAGWNGVQYKWWGTTPPGWEPLERLVRELAALARVNDVLQVDWPWARSLSAAD
jgi:hypothetical protein